MARQWKKQRESDLAKPGFVWTYEHYLTLNFHTLGRPDRLLSGVRTSFFFQKHSENQITPGAQLYMPVRHQWANSVHCGRRDPGIFAPTIFSLLQY